MHKRSTALERNVSANVKYADNTVITVARQYCTVLPKAEASEGHIAYR